MMAHRIRVLPATPREQALADADEKLRGAKAAFSKAALACLRGAPDAQFQVRAALDMIDQARTGLRTLSDEEAERIVK